MLHCWCAMGRVGSLNVIWMPGPVLDHALVHAPLPWPSVHIRNAQVKCEDDHMCPPVDCLVGDWTWFTACSHNCGGGTQRRRRDVTRAPQYGGRVCPPLEEDGVLCNAQACASGVARAAVGLPARREGEGQPQGSQCTGHWVDLGDCSVTCGKGTRRRKFVESNQVSPAVQRHTHCQGRP